jgi:hypothetical protein
LRGLPQRVGITKRSAEYLLQFQPAYRHARHYIGWTRDDVDARIAQHLAGRGSPLVQAARAFKSSSRSRYSARGSSSGG